ncbi:hypothetical protein T484DRAFT_1797306 [Baffinella frigidus]|nr:hypothetical protein T484DRAFT_1797306 [Cryptophyta sp. CCMP2293]
MEDQIKSCNEDLGRVTTMLSIREKENTQLQREISDLHRRLDEGRKSQQNALARQAAELYDASQARDAHAKAQPSPSAVQRQQDDQKMSLRLELKQDECERLVGELQQTEQALRRERSDSQAQALVLTELRAGLAAQKEEVRRLRANLDADRDFSRSASRIV